MDLTFSDADRAFRAEVREWLADNVPTDRRPHGGPEMRAWDLAWQRTMFDAGWAGIDWPAEYGGRASTLIESLIWYEEYARTGLRAIDARFIGIAHAGPTLMACATEEQRAYHLPRILRGETVWCQGFSEPNAGSDLASLTTRAEIDGDELVITGQKTWGSFADVADYQELLVRTSHGDKKHHGITWVIGDMRAPGIEIRPIRTIDGRADFAEVFYDEVRLPISSVVGEIDQGWSVAMATLSFERGTAFTVNQVQLGDDVERLIAIAGDDADLELRRRLAGARAAATALRSMTYVNIGRLAGGASPGPEGSMIKLLWSDLIREVDELAMAVLGTASLSRIEVAGRDWAEQFLFGHSHTIAGGTSEIQRNIIAERVLGLPR